MRRCCCFYYYYYYYYYLKQPKLIYYQLAVVINCQNIREHVYIVNIAGVEQVMFKTGI